MPGVDNNEVAQQLAEELTATDTPERTIPITDPQTLEELRLYTKALREEYEERVAETPDNVEEHTSEFFKASVPYAAAQIVWLSQNADSESVKLNASKMVLTMALKEEQDAKNPLADLLRGLKANDKTSPAPQET